MHGSVPLVADDRMPIERAYVKSSHHKIQNDLGTKTSHASKKCPAGLTGDPALLFPGSLCVRTVDEYETFFVRI